MTVPASVKGLHPTPTPSRRSSDVKSPGVAEPMTFRTSKSLAAVCAVAALALAASACTNASSTDQAQPNASGSRTGTTYTGTDFTKNEPVTAPGVTPTEIHVATITSK